jgi:NTP pyrophosphatase (non-canonical NTP hydrolase)
MNSSQPNDIIDLQKKITAFRDARDWKQFHNPKDLAISLALEASEVLEHFQWKSPDEMKAHIVDRKEDISDELADVFYWVLLMAYDLDIDLKEALEHKLIKNEQKYPADKAAGNHKKYTELTD